PKTRQGSKEDAGLFAPERINFRIRDDVFQAGMLGKFNIAGWTPNMVFQTRGKFEPGESGFKYTPDELYLGSLPVHKVPMLAPFFVKRVLAAQELPEDVTDTWEKLKLVAVEGNVLRLVLP